MDGDSDPNSEDDEDYIVRLVGQVVRVSVESVRLVEELGKVPFELVSFQKSANP